MDVNRFNTLVNAKSGTSPKTYGKVPRFGVFPRVYSVDDYETEIPDTDLGNMDMGEADNPKSDKKDKMPKKNISADKGGKGVSSDTFAEYMKDQNDKYADLFKTILSRMPSEKEYYGLSKEFDSLKGKVEAIEKEIEDIKPPTQAEKAQQVRDASGGQPVGDYWRDYYSSNSRDGRKGLDSISGRSFRDYLNIQ